MSADASTGGTVPVQDTILFIGPLPEPVTGQSLACQVFFDALQSSHRVEVINLSKRGFAHGIDSLARIGEVFSFIWQAWRKSRLSEAVYFTISESLVGNLKDLLFYLACFDRLPSMAVHLHGGAGMRELLKPGNRWMRAMNGFFLRRIGAVIVLGKRHVDMFDGLVAPEQIHIVPNFAEDALFLDEPAIRSKFDRASPLKLLFLSNLLPGKGHVELVEAFRSLDPADRVRLQVDFAGGFQSEEQRADFLRSIGDLPQLRYHGMVRGERKLALFHDAHLFCLPTYYPYEGQPISILEAYASGCAVLTTDHSGILDVFDSQRSGFCVAKRSSAAIRQAIEQALADPKRLRTMALHNRTVASEEYRTDRYNARLIRILDGLRLRQPNWPAESHSDPR